MTGETSPHSCPGHLSQAHVRAKLLVLAQSSRKGESRTWCEDKCLGMGLGGHPCFLVDTMASHFNPIPFLTSMKGQQDPLPPITRRTNRGSVVGDQRSPGIFGDPSSPAWHGGGRAGLFLRHSWPVTSECPAPFQGVVISQQKLAQEDGVFSPCLAHLHLNEVPP